MLRERIDRHTVRNALLGKINDYLFGELGFKGNEQNYYEPDNSYLNRVPVRRSSTRFR